jgi:hypothetical protein
MGIYHFDTSWKPQFIGLSPLIFTMLNLYLEVLCLSITFLLCLSYMMF